MSYTFQHREEIDLQMVVDEQTRKLQRFVDEATLDKAADTLANFGYVKADGKSRWLELFGTPERAALTLFAMCHGMRDCGFCPIGGSCTSCDGAETIREWLRGDADA